MREEGQRPLTPTPDQQRVIEQPLAGAVLVVAGAGSGKTETIANRVVWLAANRMVDPSEILGLTFTKKAAGELAERLRHKLHYFVARATAQDNWLHLSQQQQHAVQELSTLLDSAMDSPEVSTYNAFAVAVAQEFSVTATASGVLIDESTAFGLAQDIVLSSAEPGLSSVDVGVERLTKYVLSLDREASEHLSVAERVIKETETFLQITDLPRDQKALDQGVYGGTRSDLESPIRNVTVTNYVAKLAREYAAQKRARGLLEYSDQVALAIETVETSHEAIETLRRRHRVVFLDEMQDTSVAQTRLLSTIYRGMSVMAVGDPNQSIYGWRGASTESLSGFHRAFGAMKDSPQTVLSLATSWRNSKAVLAAANVISGPLRASTQIPVAKLDARDGAPDGRIDARYVENLNEETQLVADWVRAERETHLQRNGGLPTAAVLFRTRKLMHRYAAALNDAGVPHRIVGVGGLLRAPEIVDIVATLRCVSDPQAGNDLLRLLVGAKFAIGVTDIRELRRFARWLSQRDHTHRRIDTDSLAVSGALDRVTEEKTLLDALDVLSRLDDDHSMLAEMSKTGRTRLREVAQMLQHLRVLMGAPVPELITAIVRALGIDIELAGHERWQATEGASANANIHQFVDEVRRFLEISDDQSVHAVLRWLERSEDADELAAYVPPPVPGEVQLTTVHSAKGLEWDIVAVPNLSEGSFPTNPKSLSGWLSSGKLPYALRGDRQTLPELSWQLASTQKELSDRVKEFREAHREIHADEERRLMYVAVTRAKSMLLLSGSFWRGNKTAVAPAEYLRELAEAGIITSPPDASRHDTQPDSDQHEIVTWPLDPLGLRRKRVLDAARAVVNATDGLDDGATLSELGKLLLAEQRAPRNNTSTIDAWRRINASAFHDFVEDPATSLDTLRRPVPQRPFRRTRIGNLFHDWVEQRTTTPRGLALTFDFDELDHASQDVSDGDQQLLDELIATFERSRWATRKPVLVEEELTIPFADRRVVCKLDAVYETNGRIEIVDWKTGRVPKDDTERSQRFLQLDLYRVAYAETYEVPLEQIDATLFYVRDGVELSNDTPRSREELERVWRQAVAAIIAE